MLENLLRKVKAFKDSALEKVNASKKYVAAFVASAAAVFMAVPVSAATDVDIGITTEMLEPLIDYITENIAVIMPIGITIMGIMVGIGLIPRIISKFTHT